MMTNAQPVDQGVASTQPTTILPSSAALAALANEARDGFREAEPFPHAVFDGLFPDAVLKAVLGEIPPLTSDRWLLWGSGATTDTSPRSSWKRGISRAADLGPVTAAVLATLNSSPFLHFLEVLSGAEGLVADASCRGGGVHSTGRGGFLRIHADADRHLLGSLYSQFLNVIVFLNAEWHDTYDGHLELWATDGSHCVQRVLPTWNRTVVFKSGTQTYHGHPVPLACPPGGRRLSLATYYYIKNRPIDSTYAGFSSAVRWLDAPQAD